MTISAKDAATLREVVELLQSVRRYATARAERLPLPTPHTFDGIRFPDLFDRLADLEIKISEMAAAGRKASING